MGEVKCSDASLFYSAAVPSMPSTSAKSNIFERGWSRDTYLMKIYRLDLKYKKTRLDVECTDTGTISQCFSTINVSHFCPSLIFASEAGA
jgi:hypothetical protein